MVDEQGRRKATSTKAENSPHSKHAWQSGLNNEKTAHTVNRATQPSSCPECGSQKTWKDGLRCVRREGKPIQRFLCRACGYRFSQPNKQVNIIRQTSHPSSDLAESPVYDWNFTLKKPLDDSAFSLGEDVASHDVTVIGKRLNSLRSYNSNCQVCVSESEAKNLASVEAEQNQAAGATTTQPSADLKGLLTVFIAKSELKGLDSQTIRRRVTMLKLLHNRGANLLNPETVFQTIDHAKKWDWKHRQVTEEDWSDGSKNNAAQAYLSLCELAKIQIPEGVNFDKWGRQPQKLPWVPLETEVDQLIAGCLKLVATFLQLLKETGMRCGEAIRLHWVDIDLEHGIVTVNKPEKHSLPRQLKISAKLTAMLNYLPKETDKVFPVCLRTMRKRFMWQRNRVALKLQNPRIKRITFHTLRHWYGTMEYFKTKDILHVKEKLGHESITSTLIYTHLVNFEADEYHTATAKSLREDEDLLKAGFEYVTDRDGVKIYRKRK